ncbi:hypothetical protein HYALB_00001856 [Hymenoscyphus albidus]|uniref:Uncharacterized protein n=1 Tax=Hymenoscyphus albidus TaxID=595503 RepID=A0A9N9LME3_9HELO|nr:hypothetical protein HYALB_00001856 [Hymenoscyphus albidus]
MQFSHGLFFWAIQGSTFVAVQSLPGPANPSPQPYQNTTRASTTSSSSTKSLKAFEEVFSPPPISRGVITRPKTTTSSTRSSSISTSISIVTSTTSIPISTSSSSSSGFSTRSSSVTVSTVSGWPSSTSNSNYTITRPPIAVPTSNDLPSNSTYTFKNATTKLTTSYANTTTIPCTTLQPGEVSTVFIILPNTNTRTVTRYGNGTQASIALPSTEPEFTPPVYCPTGIPYSTAASASTTLSSVGVPGTSDKWWGTSTHAVPTIGSPAYSIPRPPSPTQSGQNPITVITTSKNPLYTVTTLGDLGYPDGPKTTKGVPGSQQDPTDDTNWGPLPFPPPSNPNNPVTPNVPNIPKNPATSNPGNSSPGSSNPGSSNPGTSNPGTSKPGSSNPGNNSPVSPNNPETPSNPGTSSPGNNNSGSNNGAGAGNHGGSGATTGDASGAGNHGGAGTGTNTGAGNGGGNGAGSGAGNNNGGSNNGAVGGGTGGGASTGGSNNVPDSNGAGSGNGGGSSGIPGGQNINNVGGGNGGSNGNPNVATPTTATIGGVQVVVQPTQVVIGTQTISVPNIGSPGNGNGNGGVENGNGNSNGNGPSSRIVVENGQTFAINPSQVIGAGSTINIPVTSAGGLFREAIPTVISGVPVQLGQNSAVIAGVTYSIGAGAPQTTISVSGQIITIGPNGLEFPQTTVPPRAPLPTNIVVIEGQLFSAIGASVAVVGSSTITYGPAMPAQTKTFNGAPITLAPGGIYFDDGKSLGGAANPSNTQLGIAGALTISEIGSSIAVINGVTFTVGPAGSSPTTTVINGKTITIDQRGIGLGSTTLSFPFNPTTRTFSYGDITYTQIGGSLVILGGTTFTVGAGAKPTTIFENGQTISIGPGGMGFASTTIPLDITTSTPTPTAGASVGVNAAKATSASGAGVIRPMTGVWGLCMLIWAGYMM